MTRDLAIKVIKRMIKTGIAYDDGYAYEPLAKDEEKACGMAIKALEQEPTLDKIRAEISENADRLKDSLYGDGLRHSLEIIDKYKQEG